MTGITLQAYKYIEARGKQVTLRDEKIMVRENSWAIAIWALP